MKKTNFAAQLTINEVKKEIEEYCRPARLSIQEIKSVIPPYNPSSLTGLNAKQWVEAIENIRKIYKWDDRFTLLYATFRLEEGAKKWFNENLCKWQELKVRLVEQFPQTMDRTSVFEQLLARRKEDGESYDNYAYDVERIAKNCEFDLETTITYVISGIRQGGLRNHLISCTISSIPELLSRIKTYITVQNQQELRDRLEYAKKQNAEACYQRRQPGHLDGQAAAKTSAAEELDAEPHRKIICVKAPTEDCSDLLMTVKVDDICVTAFVNLGSDVTTMQASQVKMYDWTVQLCDVKLKGFGRGSANAFGKIVKNVCVGDVELLTDILVVEDGAQQYPMVLGCNFLDNRNVCVIKNYKSIEIKNVGVKNESEVFLGMRREFDEKESDDVNDLEEDELLKILDIIERDCL